MTSVVVVGAQWGDEGKGKIIDFLAAEAQMVVRCQGGSNAGHTVVSGDNVYKLHLVPSGILYNNVDCVIANGVVVDLEKLIEELDGLTKRGISVKSLYISNRAHLIMPYHCQLDALQEGLKGENKIGTTKRGIGPAYVDKNARTGLRVVDLFSEESFAKKLQAAVAEKNAIFAAHNLPLFDFNQLLPEFMAYRRRLEPYITDTSLLVNKALDADKRVLFEGAQGTLLDIDHGTYPYVTSSSPVAGGFCTGAGVGPTKIQRVVGVTKAYTTRVGDGPFPTELFDEMGDKIRSTGYEFGTTTGRPRRCGWLDAEVVRYAVMVNGMTDLAITKLDVLDDLKEIKICVGYQYQGQKLEQFPADLEVFSSCEPIYEVLPGWQTATCACRSYDELPANAKRYLQRITELTGVQISLVAVGADRQATIVINNLF